MNINISSTDLATIGTLLPCYLVGFDLAQTKRRNLCFGMKHVDQDILTFHSLLNDTLHDGSVCVRVGGDKWAAFLKTEKRPLLDDIIAEWQQRIAIKAGWRCRAMPLTGEERLIEKSAAVFIIRGVRCGFRLLSQIEKLRTLLDDVFEQVGLLPVNEVHQLEGVHPKSDRTWNSIVGDLPSHDIYCPFCDGRRFDWIDGTDDSSYGRCETCHALVDFQEFYRETPPDE